MSSHEPSAISRSGPSAAMRAAEEAIIAQAQMTTSSIIESRARKFAVRPALLDLIEPGLSKLSPLRMAVRIGELAGQESAAPRRIFGGEVVMMNLKAAGLYAERLCRIESGMR